MNETNDVRQTALHRAAMNGWLDCVVLLIESGINVDSVDVCGMYNRVVHGIQDVVGIMYTMTKEVKGLKSSLVR